MHLDQKHIHKGDTSEAKKFRLAPYFDDNWASYVQSPQEYIQPEQYRAVSAIRACRTEALGVDHYVCSQCGEISKVYHSCKNRFCPTCSWKDTVDWACRIEEQLLALSHRHVVFTIPHKLNGLIKANKGSLLSILFQTTADSIKDWMLHKYQLTPGIISVLHTFGEKKDFHTHIHMIVSWGGVTGDHQIREIKGEYVNYEFIQTKFRCKFEDKLIRLFDSQRMEHDFRDRIEFMRYIKDINIKQWHVQFEPAMKLPAEVIRYIGRYSKRACISEYKITNIDGAYISFKYKDYKNLDYQGKPIIKELTLHYNDFFPRLLQHVPLPYFRLVRYYGAYAARAKSILRQEKMDRDSQEERVDLETDIETEIDTVSYQLPENPKMCKHCNIEKTYMYTIFKDKEGNLIYMSRFQANKIDDKPKPHAA